MKNSIKIGASILALVLTSHVGNAWHDPGKKSNNQPSDPSSSNSLLTKAANCGPSNALDRIQDINPTTLQGVPFNNVNALVEAGGLLWQDRAQRNAAYEVPAGSGNTSIYAGALWMGGVDVNGQLKMAAVTFRQQGNDFWTGPLSTTPNSGNGSNIRDHGPAEIEPDVCEQYDRFFRTTRQEVAEFRSWFLCGQDPSCNQGVEFPNYSIPQSIIEWPAHGDVNRFQDYFLAPFYDYDKNGVYNPDGGDYPRYDLDKEFDCTDPTNRAARALFGDVNYWWVFNDKGNIHTETNGAQIGMEIRAQAFAFATNDQVNNMTFYNYEMINRSTQTLTNTYFGQFVDADLGCSEDDYVGCDVSRGLGFCYNADPVDSNPGCNGAVPYTGIPPAIGVDFFEGPYQDADGIDNAIGIGLNEAVQGNGIGYGDGKPDNERFGMRRFLYFDRTTGGVFGTDPTAAIHYYNYLQGIWLDGTKFVYDGQNGHLEPGETAVECDFTFPGDSDGFNWGTRGLAQAPWDEASAGNAKGDRRFLQSAGPFTLEPGAINNITVGVVWARAANGDNLSSVEALKIADQKAQALFQSCFQLIDGPHAPSLTIQEMDKELILYISNPIGSNNRFEDYEEEDPFIILPDSISATADVNYRFQGYQIFQVKDETVGPSDLENPDLARLAFQVDKKDNIAQLINYELDESIGVAVAKEKVDGTNQGITHSFKVTRDLFAQGNARLINHKKYYYIALAYSHNQYAPYDPTDAALLGGQQKPYLAGRAAAGGGSIKSVYGIPHITSPERGGTMTPASYGDGPKITRIEGVGNGGENPSDLTPESEEAIVAQFSLDHITYDNGKGPINVKVIDPLNVVPGNYQLKFIPDASTYTRLDSATWELVNLTTNDTILSSVTIAQQNEQLIPEWGISVQITQYQYTQPWGSTLYSDLLEATREFVDSSKQWLSGVPDADGQSPQNWIRSGTANETPNNTTYPDFCNDPAYYNDYTGIDNDEAYEQLLSGTIAPYRLVSRECPGNKNNAIIGSKYANTQSNGLVDLESIDLVITTDRNKWTRCPVIEMQGDPVLAQGGAIKGNARKAPSVNKDGNPDGTGTGMGWFPGYAIDILTGERLNMAFGEDSWLGGDNGRDMIWNPTSRFSGGFGNIVWGGKHTIFVFANREKYNSSSSIVPIYDGGQWMENNFVNASSDGLRSKVWRGCMYVAQPLLSSGAEQGTAANPYAFIATDVKTRIRVSKPYRDWETDLSNNKRPMYQFSTADIATRTAVADTAVTSLDLINVVPNPYYAYSAYERDRLDNRIKITNLPDVCSIKIFNTSGTLVRSFDKDSPITSLDWDLKNEANIPIASGVYIIYVNVPGAGEKIVKWFGAMRPPDLENF